jgi:5'-methylthioadenosine phosphorylase
LAVVANYAAGRKSSAHLIRLNEAHAVLEKTMIRVRNILEWVVTLDAD